MSKTKRPSRKREMSPIHAHAAAVDITTVGISARVSTTDVVTAAEIEIVMTAAEQVEIERAQQDEQPVHERDAERDREDHCWKPRGGLQQLGHVSLPSIVTFILKSSCPTREGRGICIPCPCTPSTTGWHDTTLIGMTAARPSVLAEFGGLLPIALGVYALKDSSDDFATMKAELRTWAKKDPIDALSYE